MLDCKTLACHTTNLPLCLQLELRDLKSGSRQNERLRSYDQVEVIRLEQQSYTYLYEEGGACVGAGGCGLHCRLVCSPALLYHMVAKAVPLQAGSMLNARQSQLHGALHSPACVRLSHAGRISMQHKAGCAVPFCSCT